LLTLSQLLGYAHYDYLLPHLTAKQLEDWFCWMRKFQPFPNRHDPMWATLTSLVHNQWCERSEARAPKDFLLYHDPFDEDLSADDLRGRLGLR
jgi:hypothetical protein